MSSVIDFISARKAAHEKLSKQSKKMKRVSDATHPPTEVAGIVISTHSRCGQRKDRILKCHKCCVRKNDDLHNIGTKDGKVVKLY